MWVFGRYVHWWEFVPETFVDVHHDIDVLFLSNGRCETACKPRCHATALYNIRKSGRRILIIKNDVLHMPSAPQGIGHYHAARRRP